MLRRDFFKASTLLGFGATAPAFLARAAGPSAKPGAKDTILVVIQLTGGNDGLNTVIPHADPLYKKHRPTLAVAAADVRKITPELGLHPAMGDMAKLYDAGKLCVVQGVGYPNPSQSHFRSMDVWQAGSTADELPEGWVGRALKQKPLPAFHLPGGAPDASPLALRGAPARVPSVGSLADFQLKTTAMTGADRAAQAGVIRDGAGGPDSGGDLLDFVRRTATDTYASSERLQAVAKGYEPKAVYPATGLATRLKLAAQLIDAGTGARIFYVGMDGFDTHAGQGGKTGAHAALLAELSGAVGAFLADLSARGQGDRVCVMTFSEFGRRVKENGSQGTDHGSAAPMFLAGGKVKAGVIGGAPDLSKIPDNNLPFETDFRRVYAAALTDWLGLDAAAVLGKEFAPLKVFG